MGTLSNWVTSRSSRKKEKGVDERTLGCVSGSVLGSLLVITLSSPTVSLDPMDESMNEHRRPGQVRVGPYVVKVERYLTTPRWVGC